MSELFFLVQLLELKNGETYNGHLVQCDSWMNIHLREVICTSKVSQLVLLYTRRLDLLCTEVCRVSTMHALVEDLCRVDDCTGWVERT